jgi:hypothetical protein
MNRITESPCGGCYAFVSAEGRRKIAFGMSLADLLVLLLAFASLGSGTAPSSGCPAGGPRDAPPETGEASRCGSGIDEGAPGAQEAGSTLLFTIPEHDFYPENIAYDPESGDYFLGSMGQSRILRIHPDGSYEDFVAGLEPTLQTAVGMKVDALRRFLWVCTGRYTLFGGATDGPSQTGVLLFDLDTGALLRSWLIDQPGPPQIFNDLVLASSGDAYVSTTLLGKIFRISPDSDEMEPLLVSPETQTNGITLDPTERYLFFTLGRSISRLDLESGDLTEIPVPDEAGVGTDGMYFVDGSLVVVKPRLTQISRLFLNESLDAVERVEVLAEGDPAFDYPTTGVVVGHDLVFVATSYADVPRNTESARQHPDVLIHRLRLTRNSPPGRLVTQRRGRGGTSRRSSRDGGLRGLTLRSRPPPRTGLP